MKNSTFPIAVVLIAFGVACSCSRSLVNQPNKQADIDDIKAEMQRAVSATKVKDINGVMARYVPDESLLVFDAITPREYRGAAALRKNLEGFFSLYPGTIQTEASDLKIETDGNLGYGHAILRIHGPGKDGKPLDMTVRRTEVYKKINGHWLVIHVHDSWPVDFQTGKPDMDSKP